VESAHGELPRCGAARPLRGETTAGQRVVRYGDGIVVGRATGEKGQEHGGGVRFFPRVRTSVYKHYRKRNGSQKETRSVRWPGA
jgi:hypothetical protein